VTAAAGGSRGSPSRLTLPSTIRCSGCGYLASQADPYPFRCANAGSDDVDHVLVRVLDPARLRFPDDSDPDPFIRYRTLMHSYHVSLAAGLDDAEYIELVAALERSVAAVDGRGFQVTPFSRDDVLSARLGFTAAGGVWIKDETANVSGSHKGRHLMGLLIHLEIAERLGLTAPPSPHLAIASCGNAALAAAVLARASGRRLDVFIPTDADTAVVQRLKALGCHLIECPREPGTTGDPCYLRLRRAVAAGAVPFTCQGNENGLVIEGGETLAYEMVSALAAGVANDSGLPRGRGLDHLVVQVGGGALASACAQGFREACEFGAVGREPALHTVQTTSVHPLERAYARVRRDLPEAPANADVERVAAAAAQHRSAYMWPWESEPKSIATGIIDDETYDWRAVVAAMLRTGGRPVIVTEERLAEANRLAAQSGSRADPTGSAGLAGLLDLRGTGVIGPDERVAVLFTGVRRTR
jgi:threonine synthase